MRSIIWGSPCSGKTTYVNKHVKPGDLVCDYDALYQAISFLPLKERKACLKSVMFELLDSVHGIIEKHPELDAWIITTTRDKAKVDTLVKRFKAELVFLDIDREEAHRRCVEDNRPKVWHEYIDKWFDAYLGKSVYTSKKLSEFAQGGLISRMMSEASKELFGIGRRIEMSREMDRSKSGIYGKENI